MLFSRKSGSIVAILPGDCQNKSRKKDRADHTVLNERPVNVAAALYQNETASGEKILTSGCWPFAPSRIQAQHSKFQFKRRNSNDASCQNY